jgi:hypothetical protein
LLANSGCGAGAQPPGPEQTLQRYASAVKAGNAEAAYALLSDDAKKTLSFDAFQRMLKENPEDVRALADALSRPGEVLEVTARITTPDGDTLDLVYENGAWRADISAIDLYSQSTPPAALQAFVRAFEARRYDVMMRFVPYNKREGLDQKKLQQAWEGEQKQEMERLVQALKAGLSSARFETIGNRATVVYGAGATVQMLEEGGVWKIEEL